MTARRRRSGFTLIETLAALAIFALVIGASTALLAPPSPRLRAEAAARGLCAALRATRARAMATHEDMIFTLDLARKTYFSPAAAETALPGDATIDLAIAEPLRAEAGRAGVAFYPNGKSSGADISVTIAGRKAQIEVNWLTGATRCAAP
jgi:general secretion pathway protein H